MPNLRLHGSIYAVLWNKYPIMVLVVSRIIRHIRDIRLEINCLALYDVGIQDIHHHKQAIREI